MSRTGCENCDRTIVDERCQTVHSDYTVCDSCEATVCMECVGAFNECPICGGEVTKKENF